MKTNITFAITRTGLDTFAVTTNRMMSDGSFQSDSMMKLNGNKLRSFESRGACRLGGLLTLNLGPQSLAVVESLQVGDSATI